MLEARVYPGQGREENLCGSLLGLHTPPPTHSAHRDHQEPPGPRRSTPIQGLTSCPHPGNPSPVNSPCSGGPCGAAGPLSALLRSSCACAPVACLKPRLTCCRRPPGWCPPPVYPDGPHTPVLGLGNTPEGRPPATLLRDVLPHEVAAAQLSILPRPKAPSPAQGDPWGAQTCGHGAAGRGICLRGPRLCSTCCFADT